MSMGRIHVFDWMRKHFTLLSHCLTKVRANPNTKSIPLFTPRGHVWFLERNSMKSKTTCYSTTDYSLLKSIPLIFFLLWTRRVIWFLKSRQIDTSYHYGHTIDATLKTIRSTFLLFTYGNELTLSDRQEHIKDLFVLNTSILQWTHAVQGLLFQKPQSWLETQFYASILTDWLPAIKYDHLSMNLFSTLTSGLASVDNDVFNCIVSNSLLFMPGNFYW